MSDEPTLTSKEEKIIAQKVKRHGSSTAISYLLWLFLGLYGIHRFYNGRTQSGCIMAGLMVFEVFVILGSSFSRSQPPSIIILFALFSFLWWIVDAFLIPGMVTQKNASVRAIQIEKLHQKRKRHNGDEVQSTLIQQPF